MWLIALIAILAVNLLVYLFVSEKRKYRDLDKLPGPPAKFFFGNTQEFGTNTIDSFQNSQKLIKKYGPLVRIWQGPFRLNLFVTDPKQVEFFLSSNTLLKKSEGYDLYQPWLGYGLINSTGDTWRKHRKILTPAFHLKILEQFFDTFHISGGLLIEKLKGQVGKDIDIYPYMALYAMDAICDSSMRIDAGALKNSDTTYIDASKGFLVIYMIRFFSILKRYPFFFKYTKEYEDLERYVSILKGFTRRVIKQRKEERALVEEAVDEFGRKNRKKVFLDILLDSNQLTDEEIREEVDTFLFGGHDTVSTAISFCLFELAKNPEVQKGVLEEVEDIMGKDKSTVITLKELQEMNYLDRVMKEVIRLYPPVPLYEREMTEDVKLDGMKIPKGTTISFHPYAQHRHEHLFPDPEKFDPDRFLPENISLRNPFAYIPFSAGPRNCIGQKYAMINCKTIVANMVRNFEIFPVLPEHKPILANDAVLKSVNGLVIRLQLRE